MYIVSTVYHLTAVTPELRPDPVLRSANSLLINPYVCITLVCLCLHYGQNVTVSKVAVLQVFYCICISTTTMHNIALTSYTYQITHAHTQTQH